MSSVKRQEALSVDCENISIDFGDRHRVINDLCFGAVSGQIVAIIGSSGCGKSTLLRAIAGLQPISSGKISIGGKPLARSSDQTSFVFQDPALLPWRTAEDNVMLPYELQIRNNFELGRNKARQLLLDVGFAVQDCEKFPSQLSGGMRMRTSLARALILDPKLLLLDEPFGAVDESLRWRLNELLLAIWESRPLTIVFVTHNVAEAVFLADRIAVMKAGRIVTWMDMPTVARNREYRNSLNFAESYSRVANAI